MIGLLLLLAPFMDQPPDPSPARLSEAQLNYEFHCKTCHEPGQPGVPDICVLRMLPTAATVLSLENGKTKSMGATLTADEKRAIAGFIT